MLFRYPRPRTASAAEREESPGSAQFETRTAAPQERVRRSQRFAVAGDESSRSDSPEARPARARSPRRAASPETQRAPQEMLGPREMQPRAKRFEVPECFAQRADRC